MENIVAKLTYTAEAWESSFEVAKHQTISL
jgi:hypothetical protein